LRTLGHYRPLGTGPRNRNAFRGERERHAARGRPARKIPDARDDSRVYEAAEENRGRTRILIEVVSVIDIVASGDQANNRIARPEVKKCVEPRAHGLAVEGRRECGPNGSRTEERAKLSNHGQ
jgi:hypothetical protein